ncbi:MAG: PIN domain-containing protein [Deltaproteobacteria bacterium]|nr:PIN domain-containing protein [Deltaproteobacteria bacterium]
MSVAVVDTHTLIWAISGQRKRIGKRAVRLLDRVQQGAGLLLVPTFVLAEIGEAVHRGRLTLEGGFDAWVEALLATSTYAAVDLTVPIIRRAQTLFSIAERGDRLIAATAAELGHPLLTRDPEIGAAAGVEVIW